jgi:hypothetical protein
VNDDKLMFQHHYLKHICCTNCKDNVVDFITKLLTNIIDKSFNCLDGMDCLDYLFMMLMISVVP